MPSTYTVNLGIEKPATGEQSGTWGDTTNTNFDILDQAINGAVRVTLTSAGTSGSPNSLAITNGAASDGRNKWIEFYSSSDLGGSAYVQLDPNDAEKIVFVRNSLAGSQSVILFQGTYDAARDLEVPAGVDMVVKFDGGGASAATVTDVYTKLRATEITTPTLTATTADINGGTLDNSVIGGTTAAAITGTTIVANTSLNIAGDGATVTGIKDEDDMSSNSPTKLATQQSIKAYVDSQVGTVDTWAEVLANGATSGSTNPEVTAGQALKTNTINETSAGSGVTIDSVLLKDDVVNATDIEVSSISANDGTEAATLANSTGVMTIASSVLTTTDINGGSIDGTNIGASSAGTGAFTTLTASGDLTVDTDTLTVDSTNDRVGVNVASPDKALDVLSGTSNSDVAAFSGTSSGRGLVISTFDDSGSNADAMVDFDAISGAGQISFSTTTAEAMRIDSSQRVLIGHTSSPTDIWGGQQNRLQVLGNSWSNSGTTLANYSLSTAANLVFARSRSTTVGTSGTIVASGDRIGYLNFNADDGTNINSTAAAILVEVDTTPGVNDTPGRLIFSTTADGAQAATERLRIDSDGVVDIKGAGSESAPSLILAGDSDTGQFRPSANQIAWATGGIRAMTIDSGRRLLIGDNNFTNVNVAGGDGNIQFGGGDATAFTALRYTSASSGPFMMFGKTRSATVGTIGAVVSDGDDLGTIRFAGDDGTDIASWAAVVRAEVDGTPGSNDMPGRLLFETTADGASSSTQRMQIDSAGVVRIGAVGLQTSAVFAARANGDNIEFGHVNNSGGYYGTIGARYNSGMPYIAFSADDSGNSSNQFNTRGIKGNVITGTASGDLQFLQVTNANATDQTPTEAMRIDSSQVLLKGYSGSVSINGREAGVQLSDTSTDASMSIARYSAGAGGPYLTLGHSRGANGTPGTILADGDNLGQISFAGDDGTDFNTQGAYIAAAVDGSPGANDMPTRLVFGTTPDGSNGTVERLRISDDGSMGVNNGGTQTSHTFYDFKATATNLGEFRINEMGRVPEFQDAQSATVYWYKVYERHYQTPNGFAHGAQIMEFLGTGSTAGNVHYAKITVNTKQQQASDLFEIYCEGNGGYNYAAKFDASGGANSNGLLEIWIQPQENYVATGMWTKTYLSRNGTSGGGGEFQLTNTGSSTQPSGSTLMYNGITPGMLSYKDGGSTINETFVQSTADAYKSYLNNLDVGRRLGLGQLGTTWPTIEGSDNQIMQVSAPSNRAAVNIFQSQSGSQGGRLRFAKGRSNSTNGIGTAAQNSDQLGIILAMTDDGTNLDHYAAYINFTADGVVGTNDVPGAIQFATTLDGNSASSVRMTIDNQGKVFRYAGAQKVQKYVQASHSAGTASSTLVSNLSTDLLTSTYTFAKVYMHGNENAATNASAREYILLKRTGGFEISEQGSGITYGNTNGHYALSISGNSLVATRTGTGGTGTCFVVFDVFYR